MSRMLVLPIAQMRCGLGHIAPVQSAGYSRVAPSIVAISLRSLDLATVCQTIGCDLIRDLVREDSG